MDMVRIKLMGRDYKELDRVCREIIDICKKFGVDYRGPIPLPTKILRVTTLKTPCGDGTGHGNATWDKWELRIHKRIIDVQADARVLRHIRRITFPHDIRMSFEVNV